MRDLETNTAGTSLNWFNVGHMRRFQRPDPAHAGAVPANLQDWNGYACVQNNLLGSIDPTGSYCYYDARGLRRSGDVLSGDLTVTNEASG